jgi:hypothetical protein
MKKIIIELTEAEWIEVIKLVEQKAGPSFDLEKHNKFNGIMTRMLFQFGAQK